MLYTAEDFWQLAHAPGASEKCMELVRGQVIESPLRGGYHGELAAEIGLQVSRHIALNRLGYALAAGTGYVLFRDALLGDTVRAPDIGYISHATLGGPLPDKFVSRAPDFPGIIVTPTELAEEVEEKVDDYLRAGVRLLWFVYPKSQSVYVYT